VGVATRLTAIQMENQEIQPETIEQEENRELSINEDDASVLERLAAIEDELKRGNQLFESKLLNDAAKDEIIARLHKELQGYKDDMLRKILKPVFMDIIMLADNMKSLVSRYEETPETDAVLEKYQKYLPYWIFAFWHFT